VLRFFIRDLGDWTHNLMQSVQLGDRVTVEGPYGSLHPLPDDPAIKTVWIAGGVGITPFLAALKSLTSLRVEKPTLFYCIRSRDDGPGLSALQQAANDGLINLHLHVSSEGTRLKPEDIIRSVGKEGLVGAHAVMCGPSPLIRAIRPLLQSNGVSQVHVEAFDIRTGIGPDLSVDIELLVKQARQRVSVRRAHDPTNI
jgi:predicted ferric reductase